MASDSSSHETHLCIRCDERVETARPSPGHDHVRLYYNQERGALTLCNDCFKEVKPRDVIR